MNILPEIQQKIQSQIIPLVRPKWRPMFRLGIQALSLQPFVSLNSNARSARENRFAAEMQMYRLVNKRGIKSVFASLLINQFTIDDKSVISIDFSG